MKVILKLTLLLIRLHFNLLQITVSYQTLDLLQEHGIAANDIQKLNDAGYHTVESIAHATSRKLCEVRGISEGKVVKLKDIVKGLVPMDFKTAADALEDRKAICLLTTGEFGPYVFFSFSPSQWIHFVATSS